MKYKVLTLLITSVMLIGGFGLVPTLPMMTTQGPGTQARPEYQPNTYGGLPQELVPQFEQAMAQEEQAYYPESEQMGDIMGDRDHDFKLIYEPWRTRAAIHSIAYHEPTGLLACGGGYLYDNEIHIFRLNVETNQFDKVWDSGDNIIRSDVMSLAFADTDLNDFLEIIAGSSDGHVYVFEQLHIYDPHVKTENRFEHVWTSPHMDKVLAVTVEDVDKDYRPDIIAGAWDGYVHLFEYTNHSGYPFVEEHWIDYTEVATLYVGDKVYSVAAGETNYNGLPEVIVGTRNGTVAVFENAGINIMINGYPFPLVRDNHYYLNWTNDQYSWSPIISMDIGQLDDTPGDEIAIVSQGQGVFILEWDDLDSTYFFGKVYRDYESWEEWSPINLWGLDYWVDRVVYAHNVTHQGHPEPIHYEYVGGGLFEPDVDAYPYNTGMAGPADGATSYFSTIDPGVDNCTAVVDFGQDEVGTGSANLDLDLYIEFDDTVPDSILDHFNFSVSQDGMDFEQVDRSKLVNIGDKLYVDVDDALAKRHWDWFRYAELVVYNGSVEYSIDYIQLFQVYNIISEALTVKIGPLDFDGDAHHYGYEEPNRLLVGTIEGKIIGIEYGGMFGSWDIVWDSGKDDNYAFGESIWDIEPVASVPSAPTWKYLEEPGVDIGRSDLHSVVSWTVGRMDPFDDSHYYVGTDIGYLDVFDMDGATDVGAENYIQYINDHTWYDSEVHDVEQIGGEVLFNKDPSHPLTPYPIMVVSWFDPDADYEVENRASLAFCYRELGDTYLGSSLSLSQVDVTGELAHAMTYADAIPRVDTLDYDDDGDEDLVISNGRLYLAKNLRVEWGTFNFTIVHDYFDELDPDITGRSWGQPSLYDIDQDGDRDLVLSYNTKNGLTCWLNEGTDLAPVWVEHKELVSNSNPETNFNFNEMTHGRILERDLASHIVEPYYDADVEFYLITMDKQFNYTNAFEPDFELKNSYVVATYPEIARVDINLLDGFYFINYGYHVHESWSNKDDLDGWTATITSGDLDQDGKGEIIVGDFDNNVYAFEHLTNNMYKRMFRSHDLNHTVKSDVSPYYWEEFEGISGEFYRKIWDHAEFLVSDVDLDNDDLHELIVATGHQIYVFEEVGLFGGDAMQCIYEIDLREQIWSFYDLWERHGITAIATGNDIDYDGRGEIVVAVGSFLLAFNVGQDNYNGTEGFEFFLRGLIGRYHLLGSPITDAEYSDAIINAIATGDTNKNGYREILIGGTTDETKMLQDGFFHIYECKGGTFNLSWSGPEELTERNVITHILIDDQDYDTVDDIIIGHENGFDIWEWTPGTLRDYHKVEVVTSSPNYPNVGLESIMPSLYPGNNWYNHWYLPDDGMFDIRFFTHVYDGPSIHYDDGLSSWDIDFLHKSLLTNRPPTSGEADERDLWTLRWNENLRIFTAADRFNPPYGYAQDPFYEEWPDTVQTSEGDTFYVWYARFTNSDYIGFYMCQFDSSANDVVGPVPIILSTGAMQYPKLVELDQDTLRMYYFWGDGTSGVNIYYYDIPKDDLGSAAYAGHVSFADNRHNDFIAHPQYDIVQMPDGGAALAFSAIDTDVPKADYDIWVVYANETLDFSDSLPHRVTDSYYEEQYPSITYMRDDREAIVVAYEVMDAPLEECIKVQASVNNGHLWGRPVAMNTIPALVGRTEHPSGWVEYTTSGEDILGPHAYRPEISGMDGGGFFYTCGFAWWEYWEKTLPTIRTYRPRGSVVGGSNPESDWAYNHLYDITGLDVGDTDSDGRREVVVAFGDQYSVHEMKDADYDAFLPGHEMFYRETYLSDHYEYPLTGVTVYDSNGNGWDEVCLSSERGNVYFNEYIDPSEGAIDWAYSTELWNNNFEYGEMGEGGFPQVSASPWTIASHDLDGDGSEEVVFAGDDDPYVYGIDDDGSVMWLYDQLYGVANGSRELKLEDVTGDGVPEVLLIGRNGRFYLMDALTGTPYYATIELPLYSSTAADIDHDGEIEIIITGQTIQFVLNRTGGTEHFNSIPYSILRRIEVGNFTGDSTPGLLGWTENFNAVIMDPTNGTVYWNSEVLTATDMMTFGVADINGDGHEDVVTGFNNVLVYDIYNEQLIFESNWTSADNSVLKVFTADFDGDNVLEILSLSSNGLFLDEPSSGTTQWHYSTSLGIYDMVLGSLGGTGNVDVALATGWGMVCAMDGQNGVVMWYNNTGTVSALTSADVDGDGMDEIVGSGTAVSIVACDRLEPVAETVQPKWEMHPLYMEVSTGDRIDASHIFDADGDGLDEILTGSYENNVTLHNGTTGQLIWTVKISDFNSLMPIKSGNVDGTGLLDIAVVLDNHTILLLSGDTGEILHKFAPPTQCYLVDFFLADFDHTDGTDELAVTWVDYVTYYSQVRIYTLESGYYEYEDGEITQTITCMAVGHFTSTDSWDIAVGTTSGWIIFMHGDDGFYYDDYQDEESWWKLHTANFDNDGYTDVMAVSGDDEVYTIDVGVMSMMAVQTHDDNYWIGPWAVDYDGDGTDEVIYCLEGEGVVVQEPDESFDFAMWFNTPLDGDHISYVVECLFGDMDGDAIDDLILINGEYIDVVSSATNELLWHYSTRGEVILEFHVHDVAVGHFIDPDGPADIYYRELGFSDSDTKSYYIVSGVQSPPTPPPVTPAAIPIPASPTLIEVVGVSTLCSSPLVLALFALVVIRKKELAV